MCLRLLGLFRHGTGCERNKLVVFKAALGTGKVVCLRNLRFKRRFKHRKGCAPKKHLCCSKLL